MTRLAPYTREFAATHRLGPTPPGAVLFVPAPPDRRETDAKAVRRHVRRAGLVSARQLRNADKLRRTYNRQEP